MKNKNLFVILIISFFLILVLGWMLRKITVERNMYKDVFSQLSTQDCQITESLYDQLKYDEICQFKSEGTLINSAIDITNEKNEVKKLDEIVSDKRKLIIRYSYMHCQTCIDSLFSSISKFEKNIDENNIVIMATYRNKRDLYTFKRLNKIKNEIFHVDSLNLSLENENVPYLFLLDKDLKATHLFIPRKEIPQQLESYIDVVSTKVGN